MTPRLIAFRWTPAERAPARRGRALAARLGEQEWKKILDWRGVLAFAHVACLGDVTVLPAEFGLVAGPLLSRETGTPVSSLSGVDAEALAATGGAELFSKYWGPCCALLHDRGYDFFHALRDPGGGAPLYVHRSPGLHCLFTAADDFLALSDAPVGCNETILGVYMVQPGILTRRTAIEGVEELLAGERLTLGRSSVERDFVWRPEHRRGCSEIADFDAAATALRQAVRESAKAWIGLNAARGGRPIAHRLSGGLDSSIVLAALHQEGGRETEIVCFNEYPEATPEGDERVLARAAAQHAGRELVEHESRAANFDYAHVLTAPLPVRPTHSEFSHASTSLADAIDARGARIVTSGQGGDQVLHRRRSAAIAVDAALDGVGLSRYFAIARETAMLARTPIWSVFAETIARRIRPHVSLFNPAFAKAVLASPGAVALAHAEWSDHPWKSMLLRQTPARAARAMHIGDLSYYHEVSEVTCRFMTAPVLASQPVIETALAIPPYVMTQGGFDRALARAAFADLLPEIIRSRSHKGDTTRFHNRVLERQLPLMRELLLGGELARRKLIDAAAVESALKRDVIADGALKGALMSAFMAEAWLRRFVERTSSRSAGPVHGAEAPAA
ncbi:MAG: asparagine synthase [Alphaproteobacteria bacterium]|nr:MAG: asparagine synthase [Alphaproteobacteria bacterium]